MTKKSLPLPHPPGGHLVCNDGEYAFCDNRKLAGRPILECISGGGGTPSQATFDNSQAEYESSLRGAEIDFSFDAQNYCQIRFGDSYVRVTDIDVGAKILVLALEVMSDPDRDVHTFPVSSLPNIPMFGGFAIRDALSIVWKATSVEGFRGLYLKLPSHQHGNDFEHPVVQLER